MRHPPFDILSLLVGLYLGLVGNLVTGDPASWWWPFSLLPGIAGRLLVLSVALVVAWWLVSWWRDRRVRYWRSTESPYAGLSAYDADRTSVFFGRDSEIAEVLRKVQGPRGGRQSVVTIVGPSGSGKSSLLRAGVLPNLSEQWAVVGPIRPYSDPLGELTWSLMDASGEGTGSMARERAARRLRHEGAAALEGGGRPEHFASMLRSARGSASRVLLAIDQAEELITRAKDDDRDAFLALMRSAVRHLDITIVLTVRNDFRRAFEDTEWPEIVAHPHPVTSLDAARLREVIVKPAAAAGLTFEDGLVDTIVADATADGAMPLLAHLLWTLYPETAHRQITREDYERAGGVAGAITGNADELYESLAQTHTHQTVDEVLLSFLAWNGENAVIREVDRKVLSATDALIVDDFRAERLIVDRHDGASCVLAHEALLREWHTLHRLIDDHRKELQARQQLEQRAAAWKRDGESTHDMLSGPSLANAIGMRPNVSPETAEFINASREFAAEDAVLNAERAADMAREARFRDPELAIALAKEAVEEAPHSAIARLTLWGLAASPDISRVAMVQQSDATSLVWLDDQTFRSANADGAIYTWNWECELIELTTLPDACGARSVLSSDGRKVASSYPSELVISDADTGQPHRRIALAAHARDAKLSWSFDDTVLVDSAQNWMWTEDWDVPKKVNPRYVHAVWSHRGHLLATWAVRDGRIAVLDRKSGKEVEVTRLEAIEHVEQIAWSPRDDLIAVAISDSERCEIVLWNWRDGIIAAHWNTPSVSALAWAPDGQRIAAQTFVLPSQKLGTEVEYGRITIWDARDGTVLVTGGQESSRDAIMSWSPNGELLACIDARAVTVHDGDLRCVSRQKWLWFSAGWSADHTRLATLTNDHELRIHGWDLTNIWMKVDRSGLCVSMAPLGDRVAVSHTDFEDDEAWIGVYDSCDLNLLSRLDTQKQRPTTMLWSPDGGVIAFAATDFLMRVPRSVWVWDISTKSATVMTEDPTLVMYQLAWHPEGIRLASIADCGELRIWDPRTGQIVGVVDVVPAGVDPVSSVRLEWAPNGQHVALSIGESLYLINVDELTVAGVVTGHSNTIHHICWSPDSLHISSVALDKTIRMWRAGDGRAAAVIDLPSGLDYWDLWWSEGDVLNLSTDDARVRSWDVSTARDERLWVSGADSRHLTDTERHRYGLSVPAINHAVLWDSGDTQIEHKTTGEKDPVSKSGWHPEAPPA